VQKGWSIFFGLVLGAIFVFSAVSPWCGKYGWGLPENVSKVGAHADLLFYIILGLVVFFYVLTEVILVWAMWRYAHQEGHKAHYTHGNHRLELAWTFVPAAILLFIAFAQISTWMDMKYQSRLPPPDITIQISARQWEWRMRYPARPGEFSYEESDGKEKARQNALARQWAEHPQIDDVHVTNEIHTWKGATVKAFLKTQDVLHSFTLPNLRFKQDALPGKTIPVWFSASEANTTYDRKSGKCSEPGNPTRAWEIACQEHCGARHYAMRGRLYVHETREDYEAWLADTLKRQRETAPEPEPGPEVAAAGR
jgi:cytochrome c oxidase subunit 2